MARPATISQPPTWNATVPPHNHIEDDVVSLGAHLLAKSDVGHTHTGLTIPAGIIVLWAGLVANIPTGWNLCDGTNGTPDLRDRFIKGASGNPGGTGGAASHSHTPGTYAVSAHSGTAVDAHAGVTVNAHSGAAVADHSYTPAGTNSAPTFTGVPLAIHNHELPLQLVSGTSARHLASSVFGTGTSRAAQGGFTKTANTTSAAVALSEAKSAGTPAGTVSVPVFTGTPDTLVHGVTQPANHVVTQPNNHVVTQPANHTLSGASDTVNHEPAWYALAFIQKA